MSPTVIVALPSEDEPVNKVSSEKVPHLTMLYLGEADLSAEAILYVQHACSELSPFGLSVDHRGTLGEDEADVLFFEKNVWDLGRVAQFRHHLLLNDEIKRAYDSADQFPEWNPHLTLGYPETPANENEEDRGLRYIDFDRIAVWTGDYEGPEFRLKYADHYSQDVAMSDLSTSEKGARAASEMFHYGVKGMKWGVTTKDRAAQTTPRSDVTVTQKKPGSFAKTSGGKGLPLSEDARAALESRQKAKASTTDALSNVELQKLVTRMNLEQQYSNLAFQSDRRSKGVRFVAGLLGQKRYGQKRHYTDSSEQVGEALRKNSRTIAKGAKSAADINAGLGRIANA